MSSKTLLEKQDTQINYETREIKEKTIINFGAEPPYVKVYITDIANLLELPSRGRDLIYMLIRKMDYDGIIAISKRYREEIGKLLGISEHTVQNQITELCKKDFLKRISLGEYEANPELFSKDHWARTRKRRDCWNLSIDYDSEGNRKIIGQPKKV